MVGKTGQGAVRNSDPGGLQLPQGYDYKAALMKLQVRSKIMASMGHNKPQIMVCGDFHLEMRRMNKQPLVDLVAEKGDRWLFLIIIPVPSIIMHKVIIEHKASPAMMYREMWSEFCWCLQEKGDFQSRDSRYRPRRITVTDYEFANFLRTEIAALDGCMDIEVIKPHTEDVRNLLAERVEAEKLDADALVSTKSPEKQSTKLSELLDGLFASEQYKMAGHFVRDGDAAATDGCPAPLPVMLCSGCTTVKLASAVMQRCTGCDCAIYCDRACQVKHWKRGHKGACKRLKKERLDAKTNAGH
jgi:hypothetical protein